MAGISTMTVAGPGTKGTYSAGGGGRTYDGQVHVTDIRSPDVAATLLGDSGANVLTGGAADDFLSGRGGIDPLDGGGKTANGFNT